MNNTIEMICTECNRTAQFDIESAGFILRCRNCESSFYADDILDTFGNVK